MAALFNTSKLAYISNRYAYSEEESSDVCMTLKQTPN